MVKSETEDNDNEKGRRTKREGGSSYICEFFSSSHSFSCVCNLVKHLLSSLHPCIWINGTTQEMLSRQSWNVTLESFNNICWYIPNLVKIRSKKYTFTWRPTWVSVHIMLLVSTRAKNSFEQTHNICLVIRLLSEYKSPHLFSDEFILILIWF
jgi:hypothetical protein